MGNQSQTAISDNERAKQREILRLRNRPTINGYLDVATERGILLDRLDELNTRVSQYQPVSFRNPVEEDKIGRYRPFDKNKCVTADMEIIRQITDELKAVPPGFLEAGPREHIFLTQQGI